MSEQVDDQVNQETGSRLHQQKAATQYQRLDKQNYFSQIQIS
jgi:hypothetical protein